MRAPSIPGGEVTRLLKAWSEGDETARDRLIPIVYRELRKRAAGHLRHERRGDTLLPTDLVHEPTSACAGGTPPGRTGNSSSRWPPA